MFNKKNNKIIENYFETFLLIFLIILFLYLIKSFLIPIFLASSIVFIVYPLYEKLKNKTHNKIIPAIFIIFLVLSLILIPVIFLSISIINQSEQLIYHGEKIISNMNFNKCDNGIICEKIKNNITFIENIINKITNKIGIYLTDSFQNIFTSVSNFFLGLFVFILAFYFLLTDGDKFVKYIKRIIPMKYEYKNALFKKFKEITKTVLLDSLLIAIIQGILIGIGLYFLGFKTYILWGFIAAIGSLIPVVGTTIISLPIIIYLFFTGEIISAIIFTIYCGLIVGLSDNLLRAVLINKKMNIHSFLVLISVLGGIELFGFFGIFLGPIIISLLITVLHLYNLDFD